MTISDAEIVRNLAQIPYPSATPRFLRQKSPRNLRQISRWQGRPRHLFCPHVRPPTKHSLTLRGHRTSVSLEAAFWDAFRAIAAERGQTLNELATEIDETRAGEIGLASAIRVFILSHFRR